MAVMDINKHIFVCGGTDSNNETLKSVEKYSIETNKWSFASSMRFKRTCFAIVSLSNHLYAIGGFCKESDGKTKILDKVKYYIY